MINTPASRRARLFASLGDLAVIGCWLGALSAVGAATRRGPTIRTHTDRFHGDVPFRVDLGVFAATVLPVGLYLVMIEAGRAQASAGKRWAGLQVMNITGNRPTPRQIIVRTAVKLLPWQLAHLAVTRLIVGRDKAPATWVWYGLSLAIPAASVVMALRDPGGRALHDRLAGTQVVSRLS